MVWAAIGGSGTTNKRSELIIIERDKESKKNGYPSASYLDTLYWALLPLYNNDLSMQDNTPIHTANNGYAWFDNNSIRRLIGWHPFSPDLNPIEHMWPRLKEVIYKLDLELNLITNKETQIERLIEVLPRAWSQIPVETVEVCLNSIRSRLQAFIDAEGWHTNY